MFAFLDLDAEKPWSAAGRWGSIWTMGPRSPIWGRRPAGFRSLIGKFPAPWPV